MAEKDKATNENKPNILDLFRAMLDDHLGKEEFTKSFAKVVASVEELRQTNSTEFEAIRAIIDTLAQQLKESNATDLATFKEEKDRAIEAALMAAIASLDSRMQAVEQQAATLTDGPQGEKGEKGDPGKDGSPDMAEDIRNKLELLEGDERLDASAIKGLDELVKQAVPKQNGGTNFVISRGAVKIYDLSDQLDGSTTTFPLPAFWRVLTVDLSSTPNALRPTTDFTTDGAAMTITFTSQIDPATSLAAGQTCIITYAEL